jgi:hypothetical protein
MNMIQHLERHLGEINFGWSDKATNLQVVLFKNQPTPAISTFSTLGLSNEILDIGDNKKVRQELIFSVYEKYESEQIVRLLINLAERLIETGRGLLRGEIIVPDSSFIDGTSIVGIYASIPVFFEESFHLNEEFNPPVVIVWLIPLLREEIDFLRRYGWNSFESELENRDCDFWDINRKAIFNPASDSEGHN